MAGSTDGAKLVVPIAHWISREVIRSVSVQTMRFLMGKNAKDAHGMHPDSIQTVRAMRVLLVMVR